MSMYFPNYLEVETYEGVLSACYELGDEYGTTVMISRLQPGARVSEHSHTEAQIGLSLDGQLSVVADGQTFRLSALEQAYYLPPNVPHSAVNDSDVEITTVDIKRANLPAPQNSGGVHVLTLTPTRTIKTGITMQFFVGPWFEIMMSTLPKGAVMPMHDHMNEQIGIGVLGHYTVQVGEEKLNFGSRSVYYAPSGVRHGGWNENCDYALSLNIFIPPRYYKERNATIAGGNNAATFS